MGSMNRSRMNNGYAVVLGLLLMASAANAEGPAIKACFIGYEEDDLIFHVTNGEIYNIDIKGISFRGQILYRPLEKNHLVPALTEKEPLVVKFRSNGDYVWSENHMQKFRMAYSIVGSPKRYYVEILPEMKLINP